jgi:hypothetical protein
MKSSFHSLSFLLLPLFSTQFNSSAPKLVSWQTGVPKLSTLFYYRSLPSATTTEQYCWIFPYNHFPRTPRKTICIVNEACLLICCLATDVLFLRALARSRMCLRSRCLARGIHVTVSLLQISNSTFLILCLTKIKGVGGYLYVCAIHLQIHMEQKNLLEADSRYATQDRFYFMRW